MGRRPHIHIAMVGQSMSALIQTVADKHRPTAQAGDSLKVIGDMVQVIPKNGGEIIVYHLARSIDVVRGRLFHGFEKFYGYADVPNVYEIIKHLEFQRRLLDSCFPKDDEAIEAALIEVEGSFQEIPKHLDDPKIYLNAAKA